jgi:hypothetical protein
MTTATYKILGQSAPSATTSTDLYTVPSATEAIISSIVVANRGTTGGTFRISVSPNGAGLADSQYIAYDVTLVGNSTTALTLGITVDATDVIRVYASSANFTFSAFGSEIA